MKTYVLIYDGFAQFEVSIVGYLMHQNKHEIVTISNNVPFVTSAEGFKVMADKTIEEVDIEDVDLFLIPGGYSYVMLGNDKLSQLLRQLNETSSHLAAICHGPVLLAEAGVLEKRNFTSAVRQNEKEYQFFKGNEIKEDVVIDGNIITGQGNAFVEFAIQLCNKVGIFKDEAEMKEYYEFFKNVKNPVMAG